MKTPSVARNIPSVSVYARITLYDPEGVWEVTIGEERRYVEAAPTSTYWDVLDLAIGAE